MSHVEPTLRNPFNDVMGETKECTLSSNYCGDWNKE